MSINKQKLEEIMLDLGHAENLLGTGYLRHGVELYDQGMRRMTKELYPAIAEMTGSTPTRVERAMRHSIETAWDRGSELTQLQYFGWSVNPDKGAPTVGEYVARMARVCHAD